MVQRELLHQDFGPIFNKVSFEFFKSGLRNSNKVKEKVVRDGYREIYHLEDGIGLVIINNRTRSVGFKLSDANLVRELSLKLPYDIQESSEKRKVRVAYG